MASNSSGLKDASGDAALFERRESLVFRGRAVPNIVFIVFLVLVLAGMIIPHLLHLAGLFEVHWMSGRLFTHTESVLWVAFFGSLLSYVAASEFHSVQFCLDRAGFELKCGKRTTGRLSTSAIRDMTLFLKSSSKRAHLVLDLSEVESKKRPHRSRDKSMSVIVKIPAEHLDQLLEIVHENNLPIYVHNGVGKKKLTNSAIGGPS